MRFPHIIITTLILLFATFYSCRKIEDERICQAVGHWQTGNGLQCSSQIRLHLYEDSTGLLLEYCSAFCQNSNPTYSGWASGTELTYQVTGDSVIMLLGQQTYCDEVDTLNEELVGVINCDGFYITIEGRDLEYR